MERLEVKEISGGIFILIGLALLGGVLFAVGQREGIFQEGYTLYMRSSDLTGLKTGDPVVLQGIEIGYVKGTRFQHRDAEILPEALLFIFDAYRDWIPSNAAFRLETEGLMGKHRVGVSFKESKGPFLHEGDTVEGGAPPDWESVKIEVKETMQSIQKTSDETRKLVKRFEKKTVEGNLFKIF